MVGSNARSISGRQKAYIISIAKAIASRLERFFVLYKDHYYQYTLKMLFMYRIYLEGKTDLTEDEEELFMNLSQAYVIYEKETLQKGLLEGQRLLVEDLLKSRFGVLDNALSQVIDPLLQLPPEKMSPLLLQGNRDELPN
jgi:hypothetical protein